MANTSPMEDTFDRANSTTGLGNCSDGIHTWANLRGIVGISSNQAYAVQFVSGECIAYGSISSADVDISLTAPGTYTGGTGIAFRIQDADNLLLATFAGYLYKRVAGVFTQLGSFGAVAQGSVLQIQAVSDTINVLVDAEPVLSVTNATFETETKMGIRIANTSNWRVDGWYLWNAYFDPNQPTRIVSCRKDPLIHLSDGTQLRVFANIAAEADDVQQIRYTIHPPADDITIARVVYTDPKHAGSEQVELGNREHAAYAVDVAVTLFDGRTLPFSVTAQIKGERQYADGMTGTPLHLHF